MIRLYFSLAISEIPRFQTRWHGCQPHAVTNFELRRNAFLRAVTLLEMPADNETILSVDPTLDGAFRDSAEQLKMGLQIAEAYFCSNDVSALGFIKALQQHGLEVPRDVSLVGFDDLRMSEMISPSLSTINIPKQKIGALAIQLLDESISSKELQPRTKSLVSGSLKIRASVSRRSPKA
jgi:LacI family transcriptional regulator